jgi:hypothetical protein
MMDAVSVAASVSRLLIVCGKIVTFIKAMRNAPDLASNILSETGSLVAIFQQLQTFLYASDNQLRNESLDNAKTALGCVCAFTRLEKELESIKIGKDRTLTLWDRRRWVEKEKEIRKILEDLERHKSSLNLTLQIYTWFALHGPYAQC